MSTSTLAWQSLLRARWAALGQREQRAVQLAAAVLGLALLWSLALAPALRTLKTADAQNAELAVTLERMQALQARAKQLQAQPALAPQEAQKALQAATSAAGSHATLLVVGDQATVTLRQMDAKGLAALLAPAAGSGPGPFEVHLLRDAQTAEPLWSGTLVFRLPVAKPGPP